jgi:hypothetical protein
MFRKIIVFINSLLIVSCLQARTPTSPIIVSETPIDTTPTSSIDINTNIIPIAEQTQNEVKTAITWTYIDKYRLAFEVYVYGIHIPVGYELSCPIQKVSIIDEQGYDYSNYENGFSESDNLFTYCIYQPDTNTFIFTYNFYHERENFQEINLIVAISLGNFEIFSESGQQTILPDFGTYKFDLIFSSSEQLTIESNLILEDSGVTATLQRVEINPSLTTANLCLQLEDNHGWYPEISILADNRNILANADLTLWINYDPTVGWYNSFTSFRCYKFTFPIRLIENSTIKAKEISILLSNIIINYTDALTQEECTEIRNRVQSTNPDLDFICHIDNRGDGYGFGLEIIETPQGMSNEAAYKIVEDSFKKSISGNWLFSVHLP